MPICFCWRRKRKRNHHTQGSLNLILMRGIAFCLCFLFVSFVIYVMTPSSRLRSSRRVFVCFIRHLRDYTEFATEACLPLPHATCIFSCSCGLISVSLRAERQGVKGPEHDACEGYRVRAERQGVKGPNTMPVRATESEPGVKGSRA